MFVQLESIWMHREAQMLDAAPAEDEIVSPLFDGDGLGALELIG